MSWLHRARRLHADLAALADLDGAWWWLVAVGATVDGRPATARDYVASDADPAADTFIGVRRSAPANRLRHALARAHAARQAIRELDGTLPEQPLAVTVARTGSGARVVPSTLSTVAFAIGSRSVRYRLAGDLASEPALDLARDTSDEVPFACIAIGDEPIETARHGHRRAWRDDAGPWLGLGRTGELDVVSTCHLIVDGYGHARLAARIDQLSAPPGGTARIGGADTFDELIGARATGDTRTEPLAPVAGAMPLAVTWRELPAGPRALALAYAVGRVLHTPPARFSPTLQIPIAPGAPSDPQRVRRRVVPGLASVRFADDVPESFAQFVARTKPALLREAAGDGPSSRLLAAARAVPVPLAWKRRAIGVARPRWLEPLADVLGGRACISRIKLDVPLPPACAVSSPGRLATAADPIGACVVTVVDDGTRAAITLCGSGSAAAAERLDEILAALPQGI